jgi:Mn2+/Fe2+ NRAMP family transporter
MSAPVSRDPYQLDAAAVVEPPTTLLETLRRIGPGIILAASIVGSGELIATTVLGAKVGYAALWIILLSCLIKPIVQAELGRYTIATGEPSLGSFDRLPGPRLKVNWTVWAWAVMVLMTQFQVGAMFGGIAQVMALIVPSVSTGTWVILFLGLTLALLLGGGYERIERLAMVKVGLFTLLTFLAAVLLLRRPGFHLAEVTSGLRLRLPAGGIATAVAVFGMTGVGTCELFMYPYWCVEKGYARYTGPRDGTPAWRRRANGWLRVMHVDILCSMVIYTVATVAFYLLGAGVLHPQGLIPADKDMVLVLSRIYTETLGTWALPVFYAGAIVTLYGTIFAATAAHSRMYADMARLMGFYARDDHAARVRMRRRFVVVLTVVPAVLYFLFTSPVSMVVVGGMAQSILLPLAALGTVYLRHRRLPAELLPRPAITVGLWLATAVIVAFIGFYVVDRALR